MKQGQAMENFDELHTFDQFLEDAKPRLNPSELRVVRYISNNRHHALHASAQELAAKAQTSNATVVRAAKSLGYDGLNAMRCALAEELERGVTPASRMARTVADIRGDLGKAFAETLAIHEAALSDLKTGLPIELYGDLVANILSANKVLVFGIGPSAPMATYFAMQLNRLGMKAASLSQSGTLLADELLQVERGDLVLMMAYGKIYPELQTTLDHALAMGAKTALVTDSLMDELGSKIDLLLKVPRGTANAFSMHSATLAFLETVVVGVAACAPEVAMQNLRVLNDLRADLVKK